MKHTALREPPEETLMSWRFKPLLDRIARPDRSTDTWWGETFTFLWPRPSEGKDRRRRSQWKYHLKTCYQAFIFDNVQIVFWWFSQSKAFLSDCSSTYKPAELWSDSNCLIPEKGQFNSFEPPEYDVYIISELQQGCQLSHFCRVTSVWRSHAAQTVLRPKHCGSNRDEQDRMK